MIELASGDLLSADAQALVNPVNCVGAMGRGLAAQFRDAFPENFDAYRAACRNGVLQPGRVLATELRGDRYVINFPTKRHWRSASRVEDIVAGLEAFVDELERLGVRSVAVPALGCGAGGLDWADVRPMLVDAFEGLPDVRVFLFEPQQPSPLQRRDKPDAPDARPG